MNVRPRKPSVGNERGIRRSVCKDAGAILNKYGTVRIKCPILFIDALFILGQKDDPNREPFAHDFFVFKNNKKRGLYS